MPRGEVLSSQTSRRASSDMIPQGTLVVLHFVPMLAGSALVAMLAGTSSSAEEPRVRWQAPAQCGASEAAQAQVVAALEPDADLAVDVVIVEEGDLLAAKLRIRTEHGETERSMQSQECDAIVDAVALIVVSAANDLAAESDPEPALVDEPEPTVLPEPEVAAEVADEETAVPTELEPAVVAPPRQESPPPRQRLELEVVPHLRGWGALGWGITPRLDAGGGGALGLTYRRLRAEAFGEFVAPSTQQFETARVSGRIQAWSAGVRGCGIATWFGRDRLHLPICAAIEAGTMTGEGDGTDLRATSNFSAPWVGARLGPALVFEATSWLSLLASVELRATVLRPTFAVGGLSESYQPRIAGVSSNLGIEFHFPRRKPAPGRKG